MVFYVVLVLMIINYIMKLLCTYHTLCQFNLPPIVIWGQLRQKTVSKKTLQNYYSKAELKAELKAD